ncbi:hypothetical protein [Phycicoccus sp.]|uniref:hypothetical protein n=1 Tax=Phycicoccus sp. TaxID=1902410 RepID=UPI002CC11522|nr:hypothetical protein [Phycicoccus sp.]HMM97060.1 hypothetical protein [Phycicoccus sp.]
MDITQTVASIAPLAAVLTLAAPVVYLLERTHRRASTDPGGRVGRRGEVEDADLRRVRADLAAPAAEDSSAGRATPAPRASAATRPAVRVTPAR